MVNQILKHIWRNFGFREAYLDLKFNLLLKEWRKIRNDKPWPQNTTTNTILLIPPDPKLLLASKGDEAMVRAIITHFRKNLPNARFIVATAGDIADGYAKSLNIEPLRVFDRGLSLHKTIELIKPYNICKSITVGADVLDGSYSPEFSGRLLMLTDLLARKGVSCAVTGFSVSKTPYKKLSLILDEFCDSVTFNLRDPISFDRFKKLTKAHANLVADVAFLLEPNTETKISKEIKSWIDGQHIKGRKVIGLNLHPLLLELKERHNINHVVQNFSNSIKQLINNSRISAILIEHDFRGSSSDYHCLNKLEEKLQAEDGNFIFRPRDQLTAAELKGIAGYMDGVVTGRMHLMIASFGVGTPVFGIEYKGKMEGLMNHYNLGRSYLSTAHEIMNSPNKFTKKLSHFIENTENIKQQLEPSTQKIKSLSSKSLPT